VSAKLVDLKLHCVAYVQAGVAQKTILQMKEHIWTLIRWPNEAISPAAHAGNRAGVHHITLKGFAQRKRKLF
jgi:hypothetical protein